MFVEAPKQHHIIGKKSNFKNAKVDSIVSVNKMWQSVLYSALCYHGVTLPLSCVGIDKRL